jgi:hypothetical protein
MSTVKKHYHMVPGGIVIEDDCGFSTFFPDYDLVPTSSARIAMHSEATKARSEVAVETEVLPAKGDTATDNVIYLDVERAKRRK